MLLAKQLFDQVKARLVPASARGISVNSTFQVPHVEVSEPIAKLDVWLQVLTAQQITQQYQKLLQVMDMDPLLRQGKHSDLQWLQRWLEPVAEIPNPYTKFSPQDMYDILEKDPYNASLLQNLALALDPQSKAFQTEILHHLFLARPKSLESLSHDYAHWKERGLFYPLLVIGNHAQWDQDPILARFQGMPLVRTLQDALCDSTLIPMWVQEWNRQSSAVRDYLTTKIDRVAVAMRVLSTKAADLDQALAEFPREVTPFQTWHSLQRNCETLLPPSYFVDNAYSHTLKSFTYSQGLSLEWDGRVLSFAATALSAQTTPHKDFRVAPDKTNRMSTALARLSSLVMEPHFSAAIVHSALATQRLDRTDSLLACENWSQCLEHMDNYRFSLSLVKPLVEPVPICPLYLRYIEAVHAQQPKTHLHRYSVPVYLLFFRVDVPDRVIETLRGEASVLPHQRQKVLLQYKHAPHFVSTSGISTAFQPMTPADVRTCLQNHALWEHPHFHPLEKNTTWLEVFLNYQHIFSLLSCFTNSVFSAGPAPLYPDGARARQAGAADFGQARVVGRLADGPPLRGAAGGPELVQLPLPRLDGSLL